MIIKKKIDSFHYDTRHLLISPSKFRLDSDQQSMLQGWVSRWRAYWFWYLVWWFWRYKIDISVKNGAMGHHSAVLESGLGYEWTAGGHPEGGVLHHGAFHEVEGVPVETVLATCVVDSIIVPDPPSLVVDSGWVLSLGWYDVELPCNVVSPLLPWHMDYLYCFFS